MVQLSSMKRIWYDTKKCVVIGVLCTTVRVYTYWYSPEKEKIGRIHENNDVAGCDDEPSGCVLHSRCAETTAMTTVPTVLPPKIYFTGFLWLV